MPTKLVPYQIYNFAVNDSKANSTAVGHVKVSSDLMVASVVLGHPAQT